MDEFALIRRYFAALTPAHPAVALGIGDDCALLTPPPGEQLAISSDTLIAGRHFPRDTAPADIGHKALAVNLSDLAAMGAQPLAFTLALTLPQADEAWLAAFAEGLGALARASGMALIGGDTTRGPLSISITVLGSVPPGRALRRDGAQPGDLVCVTGTLGDAALALQQLQVGQSPDPVLRARLDRPSPRNAAGLALRGLAHAGIDISDGLCGDLGHVLDASGLGAELQVGQLPMSDAFARSVMPAQRLRLQNGGDDYELCLCLPPAALAQARAACGALPLSVVGRVVAAPGLRMLDASGAPLPAPDSYQHF
ncbi:thiamine-monophosphate kinase [Solimonas aquatica]|uniref:Thiamine-monophosphate kinase n=1 Tax=Solimonas aquatica TaxID=489703 RepID=A0A1H9KLL8_9GAMM|nr:thiamine-phosphate kinase [Solimonas aquatica]SEQ99807.1 thiamine-monophosphate kinase [Solimonas aquatica]